MKHIITPTATSNHSKEKAPFCGFIEILLSGCFLITRRKSPLNICQRQRLYASSRRSPPHSIFTRPASASALFIQLSATKRSDQPLAFKYCFFSALEVAVGMEWKEEKPGVNISLSKPEYIKAVMFQKCEINTPEQFVELFYNSFKRYG